MTATEIETPATEDEDQFTEPMPWYGVLAPEGVTTGDRRRFSVGSLTHRELPLSLAWQPADFGGHDGAVVVANIQKIWRDENSLIWGSGEFSTTEPDADRVVDLIAQGMLRGISVDLDEVTATFEVSDDVDEQVEQGRISSATIVRIPAFAEAFIALGYPPDTLEGEALAAAGCLPCELLRQETETLAVSDKPWSDFTQADYTDDQWFAATALHTNGDSKVKGDNKLPYKEPSGTINRNGVHAAAARFNQTEGSAEAKSAAKAKLRGAYKQLGEEPPEILQAAVNVHTTGGWTAPSETLYEFAISVGDHVRWTEAHEEDGDGIHDGEVEVHTGVVESIDGDIATVIEDSDDDDGGDTYRIPVADLEPVEGSNTDEEEAPPFPPEGAATGDVSEFAPGTRDGPGWLTNPDDSQRLRNYWTKGAGAAKIGWGRPGDFNRCRKQLAKYIANPQWLAGTCANLHKVALGVWPGQEHSAQTMVAAAPMYNLVASSFPVAAPKEWFDNPNLSGPTPLTVTEDGKVYGHAAVWGECHIGFKMCREAPPSPTNYSHFLLGAYQVQEGEIIRVGTISMDTGHADLKLSGSAAASHYDNTGTAAAYVNAGDDEYGIWVSGVVNPALSETDVVRLRAAKLSGDWREYPEGLDMVAALTVNVPGFGIPRPAMAAAGERQLALVAAGIVLDPPDPEHPTPATLARQVAKELDRMRVHREQVAASRKVFAAERAERARQARKILEGAL